MTWMQHARGALLVTVGLALAVYALARGFRGDSVDVISVGFEVALLVCIGGLIRAWYRHARGQG